MSSEPIPAIVPGSHLAELRDGRGILFHEGQALIDLSRRLDGRFCDAVEQLAQCRGAVIVTGVGKAGLIGQKIAATLSSTGTRAYFLHPTEALHGDLGCVGPADVVLVLSNSGETEEISRLLPLFKRLGLSLIAITASELSQLGQQADIVLPLGRLAEAGLHGLAPSTSTTAMLAIGDALALVTSARKNFTPQQFAGLHPAGSLGRRLTSVCEVMRQGDQLRIARECDTVREALVSLRRPGRRTGAVMIVDQCGRLTGLFTDSDLARLLEQRREEQLDRPISEVMTVGPIAVAETAILDEVWQMLGERHLSELPVVDGQQRPIGMIDITDIVAVWPTQRLPQPRGPAGGGPTSTGTTAERELAGRGQGSAG